MEAEQQLSMSFYGWSIVAVALMIVALGTGRMFWLGMIIGGHQGV